MNIEEKYREIKEKSSSELAEIAMDALEQNIISKNLGNLEIVDLVGFASVRVFVENLAQQVDEYQNFINGEKNQFYKN